jgi:two-component sensor histidine kinase/DNA-binding response OmpR family regulator
MIREHPRFQKMAIIFVSAVQFAETDHLRGYGVGGVDYVSVPVIPEVLRAKVKVFVELYRKTRALERMNDELERRVAERTAELEAANNRLRQTEERRTLALTAGDMGSWDFEVESGQYIWDEGQYRIFGVDQASFDPTWKNIRALYHPEDRDHLPVAVKARGLTERYQHEFRVIRPNGDVRWCFGSVAPTFDEKGQTVRLSGVTVDITDRKRAEEQQALLAREVDHRAKNALAVVQSILRLSKAPTTKDFVTVVEGRIRALAATHNLLSSTRWEGANFLQIVDEEMAPYRGAQDDRIITDGPAIMLRPSTAQAVALALHELATNAAKYGALSTPAGKLRLTWSFLDDLDFEWIETNGPAVAEPGKPGFGLTIVRSSIEHQLGGKVSCTWAPTGLRWKLSIPGTQVVQTAPPKPAAPKAPEFNGHANTGSLTGRRILVVEDEVLISMFIENVLADLGAEVIGPVNTLADGLALGANERLDGAVLDLNLNGEQTYPLADALIARGVPFVFITGYDRDSLDRRYARVPVLQKPIEADTLEKILLNDFATAAVA